MGVPQGTGSGVRKPIPLPEMSRTLAEMTGHPQYSEGHSLVWLKPVLSSSLGVTLIGEVARVPKVKYEVVLTDP